MIDTKNVLSNTIVVYIIFMIIVFIIRPDMLYDKNKGKFKNFGVDTDETLVSLPILSILAGFGLYLLFSLLNKIN